MAPRATFLALAVLLVGLALTAVPAMGQVPLVPTLTGPSSLAPKEAAVYNLTLAGGPTGTVSYTVQWYVTGPGASGALPSQASPTTETRNTTAFRLNVTAPSGEASVTLVVKASAQLGTTYENSTVEKAISIITPIVLSDLFYKSTPSLGTGWTVLIGIAVFFPVFLGTVALRRRQRT